ncbi:MAG: RcnB family protein [Caulobacteraceae bacterium]|nr:RcnB family protein [Caulobacter sp.]
MKRLLIAATALTMLGGSVSAALAQPREIRHDRRELRHDRRELRRDRRWSRGERLPAAYRGGRYYVSDWRARHLRAPPRGYRWVRRDNDYLLIGATTGLIASVIAASR